MNTNEAVRLLMHAAAFDNRQPSAAAAEAWSAALHDVPADQDALNAVARFYGTPPKDPSERLWIQPHNVRTIRSKIRAERLENFQYEPVGDETPGQYLASLRRQIAGVASGAVAAPSNAPALTGGPHKGVAAVLGPVGQSVPDADVEEPKPEARGPLGIICPKCAAAIGRPCKSAFRGRAIHPPHPVRRRVAAGEPASAESPEEIERRRAQSAAYLAQHGASS